METFAPGVEMSVLGHLRHFERPLEMSAMPPIATKNGGPLKRRRRATAPVEGPAPPLAWPVAHSAAAEVRIHPISWHCMSATSMSTA
jgi:hypothetical protein